MLLLAPLVAAVLLISGMSGEGGGMTAEEKRLSQTLSSVEGAGRVRVTLYYNESGGGFASARSLVGALVVADGAGSVGVRLHLTQALETLLGLPAGSVMVLKMEGNR